MVDGKDKADSGRRTRGAHRAQTPSATVAASASGATPDKSATAKPLSCSVSTADGDAALEQRAESLVGLEVKVLTQPLGAENQWVERGDGVVEFVDFTIRVVSGGGRRRGAAESGGDAAAASSVDLPAAPACGSSETDGPATVLIEDTIDPDTPFVGENCCVVWNSFDQQISLCLMCGSEEGYAACWSALVALQEKPYPPLGVDLLQRCHPTPSDESTSEEETPVPYGYYIHARYDPPLGFIEQHALSSTLLEFDHLSNPALYARRGTLLTLLGVANADLLEGLLGDGPFPMLLAGLALPPLPTSRVGAVPEMLQRLPLPDTLIALLSREARLSYLQEQLTRTANVSAGVGARMTALCHRFRNELACKLLESGDILAHARDALLDPSPVLAANTTGNSFLGSAPNTELTTSTVSGSAAGEERRGSNVASASSCTPRAERGAGTTAEQLVLAHLRFFRTLVTLAVTELGKELVAPIVAKIFEGGLLEVLSSVAENYAMPQGTTLIFLSGLTSTGGRLATHRGSCSAPNSYSALVEQELALLLDVTLVRLNERWEEQTMNDLVRAPVMAEPVKYNGLMTFLLRQLILPPLSSGVRRSGAFVLRDSTERRNPYLLFHVLGLHEEESGTLEAQQQQQQSSSSAQPPQQRMPDAESLEVRHRFQHFVITKYLVHAMWGAMTRVPLPPTGVSSPGVVKSTPIVQFSNVGTATSSSSLNGGLTGALTGSGGNGGAPNAASPRASSSGSLSYGALVQGITSSLVHLLDVLLRTTTVNNRDAILRAACNHKSCVWHFVEACCELACEQPCGRIGLDVLSGNVRFLRTMLAQLVERSPGINEAVLILFVVPAEPIAKSVVTMVCRQMTVECDVFGAVLRAYRSLGGVRRRTVFHSAVLSMLDLMDKVQPAHGEGDNANTMYDVRNFVFLKHLDLLPDRFSRRFRESLLSETCVRLGREDLFSASVSVLSSTVGSEMLRSSSKLRFVDEVEAVTGGVDGTVMPGTITTLSPAVVASVHSGEDTFARQQRRKAATAASWSSTSTVPLGGVGGGTKSTSRPALALPASPSGEGLSTVVGTAAGSATALLRARATTAAAPLTPDVRSSEEVGKPAPPRPTAPKNEKPANRPRRISSGDPASPSASAGSTSPSGSARRSVATSATTAADGASGTSSHASGGHQGGMLPKIRKRQSNVKR